MKGAASGLKTLFQKSDLTGFKNLSGLTIPNKKPLQAEWLPANGQDLFP